MHISGVYTRLVAAVVQMQLMHLLYKLLDDKNEYLTILSLLQWQFCLSSVLLQH